MEGKGESIFGVSNMRFRDYALADMQLQGMTLATSSLSSLE